ncbi:MAG: TetR/AcrR family transcriptional regulator [Bacteroidales bacterium]|nr:TetR/AcrR family transcriptional regulator [Bacteroidales bacterium]
MKEEKYLEKALALFKSEGVSMSMDTIAERMGVAKKTLYNNFESKDALVGRCMESVLNNLRERLACLEEPSVPAKESFSAGIMALRGFFLEICPVFLKEMLDYYPNLASSDHDAGSAIFVEKLTCHIERGQQDGSYRPEIDARLMSGYIAYSIFSYFRKNVMRGGDCTADHYFSQVIDFNLAALLNRKQA